MLKECIKIAFLFIGTIVGAGFATGREVVLFFNDQSILVILFAGIFAGLLCGLFLKIGKATCSENPNSVIFKKNYIYVENLILFCTFIVYVTMCAGAESLLKEIFGIGGGGIITSLLSLTVSIFSIKLLKNINFVVVPVLIIFIAYLAFDKAVLPNFPTKNNIFSGFSYMSMNMLLGGYMISPTGAKLTSKQIAITSFAVSLTVFALLFMVYFATMNFAGAEMPMLDVASSKGLKPIAGIIVFLAIFSTMISGGNILFRTFNKHITNKALCVVTIFTLTIIPSAFGFENLVNYCYPIVSYGGVIYTGITALKYIEIIYKAKKHCNGSI